MTQENAVESPDYFKPPERPKGISSINRRLLAFVAVIGVLASIAIGHTYHERLNPTYAAAKPEEVVKVETTVSPIKRPDPEPRTAIPFPMVDAAGAPVAPGLTEEEKRANEKRRAEYDAARIASSEIQLRPVASKQSQQQMAGAQPGGLLPRLPHPADSEEDERDPNHQGEKNAFLKKTDDYSPYLKHTRMPALSEYEVKAGAIIPGVMITGVHSSLPGQIIGQVSQNVYDSATGHHVLIPAGAKVVGVYDSDVSTGQERVLVAWNRVIFPDGSSVNLGTMPGADRSGYAGMNDKVDNHYFRIFGQAAILSIISAGFQLAQPTNGNVGSVNSQQILASAVGLQAAAVAGQLVRKNMNLAPTLEIRPGFQFTVMITKDIILPPWTGHPLAVSNLTSE